LSIGKLYRIGGEQTGFIIDYRLVGDAATRWWGDFILTEYRHLANEGRYYIELEDGRRGLCAIRKEVGRAATGTPTRYRYSFKGIGHLDKSKE
jgi:hypothetical protein